MKKIKSVLIILCVFFVIVSAGRVVCNRKQQNYDKWIDLMTENKDFLRTELHYAGKLGTEAAGMDAYYGCYKVTRFYPTIYYRNRKYDVLPEQEADMMLGRIIIMEADLLVTYDSERVLGEKEGRDGFDGNYILKEYTIKNPQYMCELMTTEPMDGFPIDFREQIGNVITTPQLSPYGPQYYYTISETDQMLLYSTLTGQYFLLDKINQNTKNQLPEQLSDSQKKQLLEETYGIYEVTDFLPTKFYPAQDSCGYTILPQEEADLMIGREIIIGKDVFTTYDNGRKPNSWIAQRLEDGYWIDKIEIENPEYRVECRFRKDIYGLRDDMRPEELEQPEYIEIDVYPGYHAGDRTLPQLFVAENGKIIMYAMGNIFCWKENNIFFSGEPGSTGVSGG